VDRLLLALRVVGVVRGGGRVTGRLATAEALPAVLRRRRRGRGGHVGSRWGRVRRGGSRRRGSRGRDDRAGHGITLGEVLGEGLRLVDRLLLALRVVRVIRGRGGVARGLATAEALAAVHDDLG